MARYSLDSNVWTLASGVIKVDGSMTFMGLQSLDLSDEVDSAAVFGNGQRAVGRRRGQYRATGSLTILWSEWDQLAQYLGTPISEQPFDITATYSELTGDGITNVEVSSVTIQKIEKSVSNDQKEIVAKLTLLITAPILWNGQALIDDAGFLIDPASLGLSLVF